MNALMILKTMDDLDDDLIAEVTEMPVEKRKKLLSRPVLFAAVLIAGILLITACTAMGGAGWFLQYFSDVAPGNLSAEQVEYIVANTRDANQSQTVNGYTLTLQSVFSDGRDILIQFELTAPSEKLLDADTYSDIRGTILESEAMPSAMSMGWSLQDDDRTDNRAKLLYSINTAWNNETPFSEQNCRLYVYGLEAVWREHMDVRTEVLTEGCWSFDIHFPEDCNRSIAFVQEPVPVTRQVTVGYERTGENTMMPVTELQEGQITALNLWALGAELSYHFDEDPANAEFGDLCAVMKNGEKITLNQYFGAPNFITYKVETPIILDQVDHLLMEDGTVFPVP